VSVVEVTTFRLADGADVDAFLRDDRRVQTELVPNQPGFLRRTTARRGDHWLVVTLWAGLEQAEAFDVVSAAHPVQEAFAAHMEPGSLTVGRFETLD